MHLLPSHFLATPAPPFWRCRRRREERHKIVSGKTSRETAVGHGYGEHDTASPPPKIHTTLDQHPERLWLVCFDI